MDASLSEGEEIMVHEDTFSRETFMMTGVRWRSVMYAGVLSLLGRRDPRD